MICPLQIVLLPLLTGAATLVQVQFGAAMTSVIWQPSGVVTAIVTF